MTNTGELVFCTAAPFLVSPFLVKRKGCVLLLLAALSLG